MVSPPGHGGAPLSVTVAAVCRYDLKSPYARVVRGKHGQLGLEDLPKDLLGMKAFIDQVTDTGASSGDTQGTYLST